MHHRLLEALLWKIIKLVPAQMVDLRPDPFPEMVEGITFLAFRLAMNHLLYVQRLANDNDVFNLFCFFDLFRLFASEFNPSTVGVTNAC